VGRWAVEIKTGAVGPSELRGLLEFTRRFPAYRPLLVGDAPGQLAADRAGIAWISWQDFLLSGPPSRA
jgi:hypothetical protein